MPEQLSGCQSLDTGGTAFDGGVRCVKTPATEELDPPGAVIAVGGSGRAQRRAESRRGPSIAPPKVEALYGRAF